MHQEVLLAWLHFLALIGTACQLVTEAVLVRAGQRDGWSGAALQRLKVVDGFYAAFAVAALATGAMRLAWGVKGWAYYAANPLFHAKFTLFVVIGLMSALPTVRFLQWARAARVDARFTPPGPAVATVRRVITAQLMLLTALPLLAAGMARGLSGAG